VNGGNVFAQTMQLDSLKLVLNNAKHDTTRCNALNAMIEIESDDAVWPAYNEQMKFIAENNLVRLKENDPQFILFKKFQAAALNNNGFLLKSKGDIENALKFYEKGLKIQEEIGDRKGLAASLNNFGVIYNDKGDIPKSLNYYSRSLRIYEELGDKYGLARILSNIAHIHNKQGDIPKALNFYDKSLRIQEAIGDKYGIARTLNNTGSIYDSQGDYSKALEYYLKSLKIKEEIGDKSGIAYSLNNIGTIYQFQGDPFVTASKEEAISSGIQKALEYHQRSLKIREEIGDKFGATISLSNIAAIYLSKKEMQKALEFYERSLKIREDIGDKNGITTSLNNIGLIYLSQKKYDVALRYCSRSMNLSKDLGFPMNIKNAASSLNQLYKAIGKYELALLNYELFIQMRDSINNEATRKASIRNQLKYEYEKQAAADSVAHAKDSEIKNAELAKQKAEISVKKNQQYALFWGLSLVCVFAVFMFNRYKVTKTQKSIIEDQKEVVEEQKKLVEEKQKEVLDSIRYAKRIQLAQIPSDKRIHSMILKTKK